ncbi:MAG: hypothetical protein J5874_02585, partial [Oscillospiraceae bacterium]|nr:hypothetical protein [Oscillospiraceae bacterium]
QIFTINADRDIILKSIVCSEAWLAALYSTYLSVAFVIAPILTFGFFMSFFKNASAFAGYIFGYFHDVYVFSELNEKSFSLGADIRENHKHALIIYTDVFENKDDVLNELVERARELHAICFKKDILTVNFKFHNAKSQLVFYTISDDESKNIDHSLKLIDLYKSRKNVRLFVFATKTDSELLLTKADKGYIKVRRVNKLRSLINDLLYERGTQLFENAKSVGGEKKKISAIIVGLGKYGTEMLKALSWYCQMDGYSIVIDAFDSDKLARDKFEALAPELMSDHYNGVLIPGEAEYTIRIHSGFDVATKSFADELAKLTDTTYVLVSLGSDDMNIRTAVNLRMLFERMKKCMETKPVIQTVIYSKEEKNALNGITNYKGQHYDIDFISDMYSETVIMNSELEAAALRIHTNHEKDKNEEGFWRYEYNYNSSIASAIHMRARIACGIPGAAKREEELTDEERKTIEKLEHRRWNAYMRSEGYVYSGSPDSDSRNDLAKMHHDLTEYSSLSEEEKRKDSRIGTK